MPIFLVLFGFFQGRNDFLQGFDNIAFDVLCYFTRLATVEPHHDHFHVFAQLHESFGNCNRGTVRLQHDQSQIDLDNDLGFFASQSAGFNLVRTVSLIDRLLVEFDGGIQHFGLHFQHFSHAAFEIRQVAFDFFFPQLAQDLLEFGNGLVQFLASRLLIFNRTVAVVPEPSSLAIGFLTVVAVACGAALRRRIRAAQECG